MAKTKVQNTSGVGGSPVLMYRPPMIDTTRRREVIHSLTNALYSFLTLELDEMEEAAKQPPMPLPKFATPDTGKAKATTECLS